MSDAVNRSVAPDVPLPSAPPRFRREGRAWQLALDSLADLRHALDLDDALWVANSAPAATLATDPVFLKWLDADQDGRIRQDAVRAAIRWLLEHLHPEPLGRPGETTLALEAIRPDGAESKRLLTAARKVARRFGDAHAATVTLDQVREIIRQFEAGGLDRPGVVRPEGASGPARELIEDVLATLDTAGASPAAGITLDQLERFLSDARRYLAWLDESHLAAGADRTPLLPLGADTPAGYELFQHLAPRLDHFFALCDAVRFSLARPGALLPGAEAGPPADWNEPQTVQTLLQRAPVAWPVADGRLDFNAALNPYWREALEAFRQKVLAPLLGESPSGLDATQWQRVKRAFAPYADWLARQPATPISRVAAERLRRYLAEPDLVEEVRARLRDSHATAFDLDNLRRLEKLILFQAHLLRLANSFVNVSDLYHPDRRALFEMGTLIMDGRRFTFSVKVTDRALHARFSNASNLFVLYAEITGQNGAKLYEVAVPVTAGSKGTLQVDKWGTFIDCEGRHCNARIVHIVENPISIREAVAAPFKRLGRALVARFGERSAEEEKKLEAAATQTLVGGAPATTAPDKRPAWPWLANPGGMVAGGGIAVAALGSSLAFITKTLSELHWTAVVASLLGAVAAVIAPVTIVALVKLAGRDLSCMLEGSGWGINARMALTRKLAATFTHRPQPLLFALKARARRRRGWWLALLALGLSVIVWFWCH